MAWGKAKCEKLVRLKGLCNQLARLEIQRTLDQAKRMQQTVVISNGMGQSKRSG